MKKTLIIIGIVAISAVSVSSCNSGSNNFPEHQTTLDSLSQTLDKVVIEYNKWDIDSLVKVKKTVDDNLKIIGSIYTQRQDTMNFDQGLMVGNYKSGSKVFKRLETRHQNNVLNINLAKKQLESLKTDIKSGGIRDTNLLNVYLSKEKKEVSSLIVSLEECNDKFSKGLKSFDKFQPKVVHLLDSLRNGNNN